MAARLVEIDERTDRVAREIVDAAFTVHKTLGPGLLEHVYEVCLAHELARRDLRVERQFDLPVVYDSIRFEAGYKIDLIVEDRVIVELKVVEKLLPIHQAQLLTYLKLADKRLGLLIDFNTVLIKDGIKRMVSA